MSEAGRTKVTAKFSVVSSSGKGQIIVSESGSGKTRDLAAVANAEGEARFQEGYKAGHRDCEKKMAAEIQALEVQAQSALQELPNALNNYFSLLEKQMKEEIVSLSFVLAETILRGEMSRREQLEPLLRETVGQLKSLSGVAVRLNPAVCQSLEKGEGPNLPGGVRIIADPSLQAGEAFIETQQGMIDATLEGRLEALREACDRLKSQGEL